MGEVIKGNFKQAEKVHRKITAKGVAGLLEMQSHFLNSRAMSQGELETHARKLQTILDNEIVSKYNMGVR